jgi:hypothetical protein
MSLKLKLHASPLGVLTAVIVLLLLLLLQHCYQHCPPQQPASSHST